MNESCTESTRGSAEDILGTAPANTRFWFLVESRNPFNPKVTKQGPVYDLLSPLIDRLKLVIPSARVQFIRRAGAKTVGKPLVAFIADARGPVGHLWTRSFTAYDELLDMDWSGRDDAMPPSGFKPHDRPLVLVCTHGKRDACCALHGRAFMKGLSEANSPFVWESSHIGGHRFAATCVTLPDGHYYGHLSASDANKLVEEARNDRLYDLRTYRGLAQLPMDAQFAEGRLRQRLQLHGKDEVLFMGQDPTGVHAFRVVDSDQSYRARVHTSMSNQRRRKSCGTDVEPFPLYSLEWLD